MALFGSLSSSLERRKRLTANIGCGVVVAPASRLIPLAYTTNYDIIRSYRIK
jgi:hypothetical protein